MGCFSRAVVVLFLASIFAYLNVDCNEFLNIDYYSRYTCPSATVVDLGPVASVIQCAVLCLADSSCTSLTYNPGTQECRGNLGRLLLDNCTTGSKDDTFYLATSRAGSFGRPCKPQGCFTDGLKCNHQKGTCTCKISYGISRVAHSCLKVCETYGSFYTRVRGPYLDEHVWPLAQRWYLSTQNECQKMCTEMAPNVCKSITWNENQGKCGLRTLGYRDVPEQDRLWNSSQHYIHRQCD